MTDLSLAAPRGAASTRSRPAILWPAILVAMAGAAAIGGGVVGRLAAVDPAAMEWQLALLLRFMAVVKGAMAAAALALALWRLRRPASDRLALGYAVAVAMMATAPGLIWSLGAIVPGAGAFHAGLILYLVLAWRDGAVPLPAARLSGRPRAARR